MVEKTDQTRHAGKKKPGLGASRSGCQAQGWRVEGR